jgi:hypothetical protein
LDPVVEVQNLYQPLVELKQLQVILKFTHLQVLVRFVYLVQVTPEVQAR